MTQPYQTLNDTETVLRVEDNAYIPNDPANRDRQEFDAWVAEGNTPDPPPPPPEPPEPAPVELPPVMPVGPNDAVPKAYVDVELGKITARVNALEARAEVTPT